MSIATPSAQTFLLPAALYIRVYNYLAWETLRSTFSARAFPGPLNNRDGRAASTETCSFVQVPRACGTKPVVTATLASQLVLGEP